jgi:ketosteroid isomerase-like protein
MATSDAGAEAFLEQSHSGWAAFITGNPEPVERFFSRRDDVSVGNPFGPFVQGWSQSKAVMERAAELWREGEVVGFERIATYGTDDLVCFVEVERYRAQIGDSSEPGLVALRVTTVVRREDDGWKIACRHADPITSVRPVESVLQG